MPELQDIRVGPPHLQLIFQIYLFGFDLPEESCVQKNGHVIEDKQPYVTNKQ